MSHSSRAVVCLAVLLGTVGSVVADSDAKQPSVFDLPRLQAAQAMTGKVVAQLFARGDYAGAAKLLQQAAERVPHDFRNRYNLACVLARLGKKDEALASLQTAIELGFRDATRIKDDKNLQSLRDDARFQALLKKAAEPLTAKPDGWNYRVEPAPVEDGRALVSEKNTAWQPKLGMFRTFFKFDKATTADKPIYKGKSPSRELLQRWYAEGTAAGNHGDFYDNHDSGHSRIVYQDYPQLTRIEFSEEAKKRNLHHGLQLAFLYNGITIGNSSTVMGGPLARSQGRLALTRPGGPAHLYLQYISGHLYFYPEHKDHDPESDPKGGRGDLFPANTPYMILSQGSSSSDKPFLSAVAETLAAFRPEVKQKLAKTGLLMSVVQMVFRASNKMVQKREDYLTGKAHPTVFDSGQLDVVKMVTMAHDITLETLPPVVQLKVVEEDQGVVGRDYFDVAPRERLFDTPCAIARVVKSTKYARRMVLSAEQSKDLNNKPLVYHWVVLRGDPEKIQIRKLNEAGSRIELVVGYHQRRPIAPGSATESNRVDIGVFVDNGTHFSAPAMVSLSYLDNEKRVYDEQKRIQVVDYTDASMRDNYVDPLLDLRKDWRDEYHYADNGTLLGWTRFRGQRREEFSPEGELVLEKGADGRPQKTCAVRYVVRPIPKSTPVLQQQRVDK